MNTEDKATWSLGDWYHWHSKRLGEFHAKQIRASYKNDAILERDSWEDWEAEFARWIIDQDYLSDGTTMEHAS